VRTIAAATLVRAHRSPATSALLEILTEVTEEHLVPRKTNHQKPHRQVS
jgi:hypothetical protein